MKLTELIKQDVFRSPAQEALFNVIVTSSWVSSEMTAGMAPFGVTPVQYNVLRILRGSHPAQLTCTALGARLLDRTPDVTRLLNRLQRRGYIERTRSTEDRRVVEVGITEAGLDLLRRMQDTIDAMEQRLTRHLNAAEHRQLSDLLERLRTDQ